MSIELGRKLLAEAGLTLHGHHSHGWQPSLSHDPPHRHGEGWWPPGAGPFRPGPGAPSFGARMPETHRPGVVTGPTGRRYYNTTGGDYGWEGRRVDAFDLPPSVGHLSGARMPETHRPGVRTEPTGRRSYNTTGGDYGWEGRRVDVFDQPPSVGSSQRWRAVTRLMPELAASVSGRASVVGAAPSLPNKRVSLTTDQARSLKALMLAALAPKTHPAAPGPSWADLIASGRRAPVAASRKGMTRNVLQIMRDQAAQANAQAAQAAVRQGLGAWGRSAPSGGGPSSRDSGGPSADLSASLDVSVPQPSFDASASFHT